MSRLPEPTGSTGLPERTHSVGSRTRSDQHESATSSDRGDRGDSPTSRPASYRVARSTRPSRLFSAALGVLLITLISLPWWADNGPMRLIAEMAYFLALAQLWNLLAGYAGLVSVGQQAFVGLGGYTLFALTDWYGVHPLWALALAGLMAALVSVPVALAVFRLRGAYFAVGTWVVAEIFQLFVAQVPRLGGGSRVFWRDIHAVTGIWISAFALILLVSGLPWAKFWGDYFKAARRFTNTAVARQDWPNGHAPASQSASSPQTGTEHSEHHMGSGGGGAGGWRRGGRDAGLISDFAPVDRIVATVCPLQLPPPVVIAAPSRDSIHWTAKSITPNRPLRVDLDVNGATGQILNRKDFKDRNLIDQIVGAGVAMHEGQLFGWVNQLLGLLTALGLVLVSVSSVILWWKRRDQGVLGAPRVALDARFSWGLALIVILLGVYLPLFGGSLLLVLLLEKTVFRRIPAVRDWLGLRADAIA